ncbi:hypothetical protein [Micromonospora sp. CPCC 206061]|uniref:hypothetical protein n=1 Tax=Micromonospora sp. CPCC 206061 TaxID=3122410 RepID=UPI002FF12B7D
MNKWFYRAVGTVGMAGGFLLLGGGAAHAEDVDAIPATDPLELQGLLDDFFTPTAGQISQVALGSNAQAAPPDIMMRGQLSDLRGDVSPTRDLGFLGSAPLLPNAAIDPSALGTAPGDNEAVLTEKPQLISTLPVAGSFTDTIGADRAVDAVGVAGTTQSILNGGNGISTNAGNMHDLVPATSDVDASRAGAALPAALGALPADAIPTVPIHKAAKGNVNGFTRSTNSQAQDMVPALIGDAMVAQRPELFQPEALPPVATLPLVGDLNLKGVPGAADNPQNEIPVVSALGSLGLPGMGGATTLPADANDDSGSQTRTKRHSTTDRPVAGEDADYAEAASVGLPLIGDLSNLTSVLPTNGTLAGMPGMKHMDI